MITNICSSITGFFFLETKVSDDEDSSDDSDDDDDGWEDVQSKPSEEVAIQKVIDLFVLKRLE